VLGKDPAKAGVSGSLHALSWLVVSSGPERDFNLFAPGVMYWYNAYASGLKEPTLEHRRLTSFLTKVQSSL
jgi:hypothetical protein